MIISSLMNGIYNLIDTVLIFNIPSLPSINGILQFLADLINLGIDVYRYFIPPFGRVIVSIILAVEVALDVYLVVMWIIRKIPVASID